MAFQIIKVSTVAYTKYIMYMYCTIVETDKVENVHNF